MEKDAELVWGAERIGEVIGRNERDTYHLLKTGRLPARKAGTWVANRRDLLDPSRWPRRGDRQ
jgi:hypothetical protein